MPDAPAGPAGAGVAYEPTIASPGTTPASPGTPGSPGWPGTPGWPGAGPVSAWHGPGSGSGPVADSGHGWSAADAGQGWSVAETAGTGGTGNPHGWAGDGSWPPAPPQAPGGRPAQAGRWNRRVLWTVVVGAAAAGVAVSLVLTLVVGKKGDGTPDARPASAGTSAAPGPTEVPTGTPTDAPTDPYTEEASPSPSAPPEGYEARDDAEGFRIAVPKGWSRSTVDSSYGIAVVNYRSPDRAHRIQVYQVQEESPAASFELFLSDDTPKAAGFTPLGLQTLDDGEFTGSRLEYLADRIRGEPDVGTWHVYDERFVAADGNIYAVTVYGPDGDGREDELLLLNTALGWFCPPYTNCDAPPALY
ncbi:hypothetical protein [Streptomyces griseosporeus]|uniref:hypothetical protein n=1 Tax=Streptomyces griseosporeus TaxID=1910 RepID=UPI001E619FE6|nr:hypothetical protein [Streptomyces griseosporeus]